MSLHDFCPIFQKFVLSATKTPEPNHCMSSEESHPNPVLEPSQTPWFKKDLLKIRDALAVWIDIQQMPRMMNGVIADESMKGGGLDKNNTTTPSSTSSFFLHKQNARTTWTESSSLVGSMLAKTQWPLPCLNFLCAVQFVFIHHVAFDQNQTSVISSQILYLCTSLHLSCCQDYWKDCCVMGMSAIWGISVVM